MYANLVFWFGMGTVLGWIFSLANPQHMFGRIVSGMASAIIGGAFIAPRIGVAPTPHAFNPGAGIVSLYCAIVASVLAHVFWSKSTRRAV